jgi:hypothetical protein
MTYTATAIYFPIQAVLPIEFVDCKGDTRDEAISILMDDIREFMRREESNSWWDDITVTIEHDHVKTNYAFEYWARHFAWSF